MFGEWDVWWLSCQLLYGVVQVLMTGHIPPGDLDNWPEYGQLYRNVTKHFQDVIVGHLFGHTHMDQFQLVRGKTW